MCDQRVAVGEVDLARGGSLLELVIVVHCGRVVVHHGLANCLTDQVGEAPEQGHDGVVLIDLAVRRGDLDGDGAEAHIVRRRVGGGGGIAHAGCLPACRVAPTE